MLMYNKVMTVSVAIALIQPDKVCVRKPWYRWRAGLCDFAQIFGEVFKMIPDLSLSCFYGCNGWRGCRPLLLFSFSRVRAITNGLGIKMWG